MVAGTVPPLKKRETRRRGSRKLLLLLVFFFIILFTILFFQSSLSKISEIRIGGNEMVTSDAIGQASGVKVGESFFKLKSKTIAERIEKLKTVQSAQVVKKFPGVIAITVKEYPRAAYQIGADGKAEVLLADGSAYPLDDKTHPVDRPLLSGWTDDNPLKAELCRVLSAIPQPLLSDVSEIKPFPNVFEDRIKLYTRSQFEVITRISLLDAKMQNLSYYTSHFIEQNGTTGVLWLLDQDRGVPYGQNPAEEKR